MTANELRIGNIIKDDRKAKDWRFVTHRIISDLASNPNVELYHPVELTEEWLIKFGFTGHHGYEYFIDVDRKGKICIIGGQFYVYSGLGTEQDYGFEPNIEYVHQLQNLYFALCGEELTIKEPNKE